MRAMAVLAQRIQVYVMKGAERMFVQITHAATAQGPGLLEKTHPSPRRPHGFHFCPSYRGQRAPAFLHQGFSRGLEGHPLRQGKIW